MILLWRYVKPPRASRHFHFTADADGKREAIAAIDRAAAREAKEVTVALRTGVEVQRYFSAGPQSKAKVFTRLHLLYHHTTEHRMEFEELHDESIRLSFSAVGRTRLVEANETFWDQSITVTRTGEGLSRKQRETSLWFW